MRCHLTYWDITFINQLGIRIAEMFHCESNRHNVQDQYAVSVKSKMTPSLGTYHLSQVHSVFKVRW